MLRIAVLLSFVVTCYTRPDGAPLTACSTLMPVHSGIGVQNSPSPYTVRAVKSGNHVKVTISSSIGEQFEGFVIQARSNRDKNTVINGEFTTSRLSRAIDCTGGTKNTLTHVDASPKSTIETEWTPDHEVDEDIIFRATVAKTFAVFWTKIDSSPIKMSGEDTSTVSKTSEVEGCLVEKGCLGLPHHCGKSDVCDVFLTYTKIQGGIHFGLHGSLDSSNYMAMALSDDEKMGDDSVTECVREGDSVTVRESWNEGKSNTLTKELPRDRYEGSFVDGIATCSWTTPYRFSRNGRNYDLSNKNYYVLLAKGPVDSGTLKYHTHRMASGEVVNFTLYEAASEGVSVSVKVHGIDVTEPQNPTTDAYEEQSTTKYTHYPGTTENDSQNCSSQFSFSLLLFALLGFLIGSEGNLFGSFRLI